MASYVRLPIILWQSLSKLDGLKKSKMPIFPDIAIRLRKWRDVEAGNREVSMVNKRHYTSPRTEPHCYTFQVIH